MLEPSNRQQKKYLKILFNRIAKMNKKAVNAIEKVRKYTFDLIEKIADNPENEKQYKDIEIYTQNEYKLLLEEYKSQIIETYNETGREQKRLAEITLGSALAFTPKNCSSLPKTKQFEITNRLFSPKAISYNSKYLSTRVTNIIKDGVNSGLTINEIQKKLDIEYGFRDKLGKLTKKSQDLIKSGKFSHTNGHIYQTYRIARTEVMRMSALQTLDTYLNIDRDDKRLKLISTIDNRTRPQSVVMNGQISDKKGRFKYPDGNSYYLGTAPPQWSINDRETQVIVFLGDETITEEYTIQETPESNTEVKNFIGNKYTNYKKQNAVNKLLKEANGHVKNAFYRSDIGNIYLVWGNENAGLKHIIQRRKEQNINVDEFLSNISEVIEKGTLITNTKGRFEITYQGKVAVIAPNLYDKKLCYLLTAYKTRKK